MSESIALKPFFIVSPKIASIDLADTKSRKSYQSEIRQYKRIVELCWSSRDAGNSIAARLLIIILLPGRGL